MFVVNLVCISYLHLFMDRIEWRTSGKKKEVRGPVNATNAIESMLGKMSVG